jgi:hypothetical protein
MFEFWKKLNPWIKFFIYFFLGMIFYYIITYLLFRLNYKPIFDWWNSNQGSKYNKFFNLDMVLLANSSNTTLYYLFSLFGSNSILSKLSLNQIRFISTHLLKFLRLTNSKGIQTGVLIPKSLCETILISPNDGDELFNYWWLQEATNRDFSIDLVYKANPKNGTKDKDTGIITYNYSKIPDKNGLFGVYPSKNDTDSWKGLIQEWMGGAENNWGWQTNSDGITNITAIDTSKPVDFSTWYQQNSNGTVGRGDNIFARYGIIPTSALVVYFVNNKFSDHGIIVDSIAMQNLIQVDGNNPGGWLGYLLGQGPDVSSDTYTNYIFADAAWSPPAPTSCDKGSAGDIATSSVNSAIPMLGFAVAAGLTPAGAILGVMGLIQGIFGGLSAAKPKC